jgi:hypothetical protein
MNKNFVHQVGDQPRLYYVYVYIYTHIQLRRRPPEDEQSNARNMKRILINVLYINK